MFKERIFRSKVLSLGVMSAFLLVFFPIEVFTQVPASTGSLVGFVYGEDHEMPVGNAVVKIRNIEDGEEYQSRPSDENGLYKIKDIKEGRYVLGVSTKAGDFNFEYQILVKANEIAKLSLALKPHDQEEPAAKKDEKGPRGDWYVPEVEGKCDPGYKWNPKTKRCEFVMKKGVLEFFKSTEGIVILIAANALLILGSIKLLQELEAVSKKKK